jgi:hypothetical protein
VTEIDEGRFSIEAPVSVRPEALVAELAAAGASLVSVTPLRVTLEDVFLARVAAGRDESSAAPEEAVS